MSAEEGIETVNVQALPARPGQAGTGSSYTDEKHSLEAGKEEIIEEDYTPNV